ncbi:MAG: hypothetical protein V4509_04530 [Patescibacteria group bacterium]
MNESLHFSHIPDPDTENIEPEVAKDQSSPEEETPKLEIDMSKKNEPPTVLQQAREKIKRAAQIVALLTTLGNSTVRAENPNESAPAPQTESQKQLTGAEKALILEQTGIDVASIAESANFNMRIDVPSETGEYIVHVGQYHKTPETLSNPEKRDRIIATQKSVEKIMLEMHKQGITTVFAEGVVVDKQASYEAMSQMYQKIRNDLSHISTDNGFQGLRNYQIGQTKYFTTNDYISDELVTTINHLCKIRALEIHDELKKNGTVPQEIETDFETTLQSFSPRGSLKNLGDDAIYYIGAVEKLNNEGIFQVNGAETTEGNEAAFKYDAEFEEVRKQYLALGANPPAEQVQELNRKAREIRQKKEQVEMENREDTAVDLITKSRNKDPKPKKISLLVLGMSHQNKNNVEKANKGSGHSIGLITLEPKY